jgi:uncharacterized protein YgiM (DUF1202 family)
MKQSIYSRCLLAAVIAGLAPLGGQAQAQRFPDIGGIFNRAIHPNSDPYASPDQREQNQNGDLACAGGGVFGGAFGAAIFRRNKVFGGLLGGLAGCLIAREVAHELTKNEQEELARRTEAAFDSDNPNTSYTSQDKGKMVYIRRGQEVEQEHDVELESLQDVRAPRSGDFVVIGRTYYAKASVRLRSEPDEGGEVVGGFRKGQAVLIMGRTQDGAWNMVGANGVLVGYAAADLFQTHRPAAPAPKKSRRKTTAAPTPATSTSTTPELPELASGRTLEAAAKTKVKVAAQTSCAQAEQQVGTAKGSVTGCKSPNGGWNVV